MMELVKALIGLVIVLIFATGLAIVFGTMADRINSSEDF
jgi:hypothetical protein